MLNFEYVLNDDVYVVKEFSNGQRTGIGWINNFGIFSRKADVSFLLDYDESKQLLNECNEIAKHYAENVMTRNDIKPGAPKSTHTPTNPSHYKFTLDGKEYDIDQVIVALGLPWRLANAMKYIARAGKKDDEAQDISKAITYLQRHVQ